ncbi:MAG: bile acid:sodium symporter family protein [Polyangiaceae bacterium]|nr:bile acid:sodium symporter family protein [Polyangiaceae bacterium]MCB9606203.1 bile acid:sodium symporter family protein [Polyangiaceae bacterium]
MRELFSHHAFVEAYFVPVQLLLAMFGMGATLSVRDFERIVRNPGGLAVGLGIQVVLVPIVAVLFSRALGLGPGWAVGLILVSVVPGGAFSNLLTYFGRGNVPLSISVTTVTTLGCLVTIPLVLRLTAAEHLPPNFVFPTGQIVRDISSFLLLPLALGMVTFRFLPQHTQTLSKWAIRLSMTFVVLITISALGSGRIKVAEYGFGPPAVIVAFALVLMFAIPHLSRLLGRYDDETAAISIEVTLRNIGIGLLLVRFFFPGQPENGHVLYSCLFFAGLSTPLSLPAMLRHRRGKSPAFGRAPHIRPDAVPQAPDASASEPAA